jgi:hypothetical protein
VDGQAPDHFSINVPFVVDIWARPAPGVKVYAVEDLVPENMLVREISEGGRFDTVNRKVKWGPYFDAEPRRLTYEITALEGAAAPLAFTGTASFEGTDVTIGTRIVAAEGGNPSPQLSIEKREEKVHLTLQVPAGLELAIEFSEDLVTWTLLERTAADADGVVSVSHHPREEARASFYRAQIITTIASQP